MGSPILKSIFSQSRFSLWHLALLAIILSPVLSGRTALAQNGWFWQHPTPQGNYLRDIVFLDDTTAIAVGSLATIVKTGDNGATWTAQHYAGASSDDLWAVHFVDQAVGYAAGGALLKTTNGGDEWTLLQTQALPLYDVYFHDPNLGWAVGHDAQVLRTTNGGDDWVALNTPLQQPVDLWSVFFYDADTGWIAGRDGVVLKTTDGGENWTESITSSGDWHRSLCFVDDRTGWMAGHGGAIFKTSDGGASWQPQSSPLSQNLFSIYFTDASKGWAVGAAGKILQTGDGGQNWQSQDSGTTYSLLGVTFVNDRGFTVGLDGTILDSENGGGEWTAQALGPPVTLNDSYFAHSQLGWVVGVDGMVLKTADGGNSWVASTATDRSLWSVTFADNSSGWTAGDDGLILHSDDGGVSWTPQTGGAAPYIVYEVAFEDLASGWAVGGGASSGGVVLRTVNGGEQWTPTTQVTAFALKALSIFDGQNVWAISTDGIVIKTVDGGLNWTVLSDLDMTGKDIHFSDASRGWVVGSDIQDGKVHSVIYRTLDGGTNWELQYDEFGDDHGAINAVHFIDIRRGWAVGEFGEVLYTWDAGWNWLPQPSGTSRSLSSVFFLDHNTGWTVGTRGLILKTTTGGDGVTSVAGRAGTDFAPTGYELLQNYPNPFNPATVIRYTLPMSGPITLKVYDILGGEIATLVDEVQAAGTYKITFQADHLPSGIYFYQLSGGGVTTTRKMVFLE